MTTAVDLRTETRVSPLGIDARHPALSWTLPAGSAPQAAYQIEVTSRGAIVWDSRRVSSPSALGVRYGGPAFASRTRYEWRVRVWLDGDDGPGPWSPVATFETALLEPSEWTARWITGPAPAKNSRPALYLRGVMQVPTGVVQARAYVSALGWYRFFVNGADMTGPALVPRWTPYQHYVEYQTYDVTGAITEGANVLAMAVGDGRFRGALSAAHAYARYGDRLAGLVQLHLDLEDGSTVVHTSDGSWHAGTGRILAADPKDGERADLRIPDKDWLQSPSAPGRFSGVDILATSRRLIAEQLEPVRDVERLPARSVVRTASGRQIVDFGQNFTGVVRIRLTGSSGSTVRLTHSEVLTPSGDVDVDYVHMPGVTKWYQRDEVVLDGTSRWYEPWFTIHGFRYLEVDGLSGDVLLEDVEGVVLTSDLREVSSFECSHPGLNQLYANVRWSLRGNFVDTPTDCPTRERAGWTGDAQVFAPTATLYVDALQYYRRYLRNAAVEQYADGRVPVVIPAESAAPDKPSLWRFMSSSAGWGDAVVRIPWLLYERYGDRTVLEDVYPTARRWVDYLATRARTKHSLRRRLRGSRDGEIERHIVDTGFHFGEWLRPGETFASSARDSHLRSKPIVATAYLTRSAGMLSRIAELLGRDDDAAKYGALAERVRRAWRAAFLYPDGRIGLDRQDDYVRAITFDLLDEDEKSLAAARLVRLIEDAGYHVGTGFLSTAFLLPVLVDHGHADVAFRLLLQESNPSWLFQVAHGATTTWETWEGYADDGRAAHSHNHYSFGAVASFLVERIAGIMPTQPGYQKLDVRPVIGGGLTYARATLSTPFGQVASGWRREGDEIRLEVSVPPGVVARVWAGTGQHEVSGGTHTFSWSSDEVRPRLSGR